MKSITKSFLVLFVLSIPLFFGLFFGLNFPEIRRNGWPVTQCTITDAQIRPRYCCEQIACAINTCASAPPSAPQCSSSISQINSNYNPATCAANNTTSCPSNVGQPCDGGYRCCNQCCDICQSCTQSCSGSGSRKSCTTSCMPYSCNCVCCSWTSHLACTLSCPTCYSVNLSVTYTPWGSSEKYNAGYHQEFSGDSNSANAFLHSHMTNSTTRCYYDPKHSDQVLLDVSFTTWKWVISAIFGVFPLALASVYFFVAFAILPIWRWCTNSNKYQGVSPNIPQYDEVASVDYKKAEAKYDSTYSTEQLPAPPPPYM